MNCNSDLISIRESRGEQHLEAVRSLPFGLPQPVQFARLIFMTERVQKNESALLHAAIALIEARSVGMVTADEWTNLAHAVETESGQKIEWRTHDELADAEDRAIQRSR